MENLYCEGSGRVEARRGKMQRGYTKSTQIVREEKGMELSDVLVRQILGGDAVKTLAKTSGAKKEDVQNVLSVGLPVLLGGMQENAGSKKGEAALSRALSDHAGRDTSDVTAFLKNVDAEDGAKILQHVLGGSNAQVQRAISKKAGVSSAQTAQILSAAAPLLLSLLGQKSQSSGSGIGSILGSLLGGSGSSSSGAGNLLGSLLGGSGGGAGNLLGSLLGGSGSSGGNVGTLLTSLLGDDDDDGAQQSGAAGGLLDSLRRFAARRRHRHRRGAR